MERKRRSQRREMKLKSQMLLEDEMLREVAVGERGMMTLFLK